MGLLLSCVLAGFCYDNKEIIEMRTIYRILALLNWAKAAQRGPQALARRAARIEGYKLVNKAMGRSRRRR